MLARVMGSEVRLTTTLDRDGPDRRSRSRPARTGAGEPGDQRARCDAERRHAARRNGSSLRSSGRTSRCLPGATSASAGHRHGHRHAARRAVADLRAVLHHEGQSRAPASGSRASTASSSRAAAIIWCDSTPGQGTTFSIYFKPAAGAAESEAPGTASHERAAGGDERVLVVDDEPAVRRLLARILRSRGYDVFETEDAHSALAFMGSASRQMDLVVTDIVMRP